MKAEKVSKDKMLAEYIRTNVTPILVTGKTVADFKGAVVLDATCPAEALVTHFEGTKEVAPAWLTGLIAKKSPFLVIEYIDEIPLKDQTKFIEILRYRQVAGVKLPTNTVIIVLAKKVGPKTINQEVYELVAHIEE